MLQETNSTKTLDRVQECILQLLSYHYKDQSKAHELLKLFNDAATLKNKIKLREITKEPSQKELLIQTIEQTELQKKSFEQTEIELNNIEKNISDLSQKVVSIIQKIITSVYDFKELEYLVKATQRTEQVINQLRDIRNYLKIQLQNEQMKVEQVYKVDKRQQKILESIEDEITDKVELLYKQKQALKNEAEKANYLEKDKKTSYQAILQEQNEQKIQQIHFLDQEQLPPNPINRANALKTDENSKDQQKKAKNDINIEVIKLEPNYYYEKFAAIILFVLTLIFVIICLAK